MAIVDLPGIISWPPPPTDNTENLTPVKGSTTIDAASEKAGTVFFAPIDGDIDAVAFSTNTVTTGATVDVRLETVDLTTGFPSGTLFGTNTNGAQIIANTDDNTVFITTLTAAATVTAGDTIALVVSNPAISPGDMQISNINFSRDVAPYGLAFIASWAKSTGTTHTMLMAVHYSSGVWVPIPNIWPPASAINANSHSTSTTPDVAGLYFSLPISVRVCGAWLWMDGDGDANIRLVETSYNQGAGTGILASMFTDPNVRSSTVPGLYFVPLSKVTLSVSTFYRLISEPSTTTARIIYDMQTISTALMAAWPGGANCVYTTAKDPTGDGDWTNFNSGTFRQPLMGLLIDGIDDATGLSGEHSFVF